jgi:hypothetical protein
LLVYNIGVLGIHVKQVGLMWRLVPVAAGIGHNDRDKSMTHRIHARRPNTAAGREARNNQGINSELSQLLRK